jgi:hypothetical protein
MIRRVSDCHRIPDFRRGGGGIFSAEDSTNERDALGSRAEAVRRVIRTDTSQGINRRALASIPDAIYPGAKTVQAQKRAAGMLALRRKNRA